MLNWFKKFGKKDKEELEETILEETAQEEVEEIIENDVEKEINETEEKIDEIENRISEMHETASEIEEIEENEEVEFIEDEEVKEIEKETINEEEPEEDKKPSMLQRLVKGLTKTRDEMSYKINSVLGSYVKIDDDMLEDIEDILISADIGMKTTMELVDNLRETIIKEKVKDPNEVMPLLKEEAKKLMNEELDSKVCQKSPVIILVVGVNGVGKTTTIGKMASKYKSQGKKVLVAAGDTFRAAAIDQLQDWGNRAGVDVIHHSEGSDPAAVIFDGVSAAKSRNADVLICDTAGRLHNKANLMKELEKINRVIDKEYSEANRETLLVLDATTGQNAMNQAKTFKEACDITGIVLTKLDGTAKGGVVIALQSELQVPIKLIGVGEGIDDLQEFDIDSFLGAIFY